MSKSLLEQFDKVKGTRTFRDTMYHQYAENCGSDYDTSTFAVVSGSATITDDSAWTADEVDNFIIIDSGNATGVYQVTTVSGNDATVSPTPSGTDATAAGRKHIFQNLEDDLNYLRKMMNLVIGEDQWNETPNTDLRNMAYLVPKRPNYVGETGQYGDRPGTVAYAIDDIDQTGKISTGAPAGEYLDTTTSGAYGATVRYTDDNSMVVSIAGGFYPADTGTITITQDGVVVGSLDLAAVWTSDGCVYEEVEGDVGSNPVYTAADAGTDIIHLSNRRCMNTTTDSYPFFWPPYQMASMSATLDFSSTLGFQGQITIEHTVGGSGSYTYASFWVDTTAQTITAPVPTVTETTPTTRYLSGVPYYDTGSTFSASVTDSETLFDRGYVDAPLVFNVSEFNDTAITPTLAAMGLTEPLAITDTIGTHAETVTVGGGNFRDMDARATATYANVFASSNSSNSSAGTFRIDTYGTTSTATIEYFDDEDKRFNGNEDFTDVDIVVGDSAWDPTADLTTSGSLVVYGGTLKYPDIDHSTGFLPVGPDYSGVAIDCYYYRLFTSTGTFTQGSVVFAGWADALTVVESANVEVHLRMPGCTDYSNSNTAVWQDLSVDQDTIGGDGCLAGGSSGTSVAFSFGTADSSPYNDKVIVRVLVKNGTPADLTQLTFNPTL